MRKGVCLSAAEAAESEMSCVRTERLAQDESAAGRAKTARNGPCLKSFCLEKRKVRPASRSSRRPGSDLVSDADNMSSVI